MNEGIYKLLDSPAGLAIQILQEKELKLSIYQKVILANHWNTLGRPNEYEDKLIYALGDNYGIFINPYISKLIDLPFYDLLSVNGIKLEFKSLEDPIYSEILKAVFDKKLTDLEQDVTRSGYKVQVSKSILSSTIQSLIFNLVSKISNYELYSFSANVQGYTYTPRIKLFNRPEDLTHLLTEQSITNLKGIMFYMTENEDWDESLLPRTLKFIKFKSIILDRLSDSIISKYYNLGLEDGLRPKEESPIEDSDLLDPDDDEDDEDIYGSSFDIDNY